MELDALMLARVQFAFTISFHIIFPAITIGLASYLVVLEGFWLKTREPMYRALYQYWLRIFAVNFGMGVVSARHGVSVRNQLERFLGLCRQYHRAVIGVRSPDRFLLGSRFLGRDAVRYAAGRPGLHFMSSIMVALGTLLSAT